MKKKLELLVDLLDKDSDAVKEAQVQVEKIEGIKRNNLTKILKETRALEKTWRELDLFFTNAAQRELKDLVDMNVNTKEVDESVVVAKSARCSKK